MFDRGQAHVPADLLTPLKQRGGPCVFFLRLAGWSVAAEEQLWQCHEAARKCGAVLEDGISNPRPHELNYYREQMGETAALDEAHIGAALAKWLPAVPDGRRSAMASGMARLYDEQRRAGKPEGAVSSLHVKMMCWLYYRFRGILTRLGEEPLPLVLCETPRITGHELGMLRLLNALGADILLLEINGDEEYLRIDPRSAWSDLCRMDGLRAFPPGYSLRELRKRKTPPPSSSVPQAPRPAPRPGAPSAGPSAAPSKTPPAVRPLPRTDPRPAVPPAVGPVPQTVPRPAAPPAARPGPQTGQRVPQGAARTVPADPFRRFEAPSREVRPNVWMKEASQEAILFPPPRRGENQDAYNTVLLRLRGVRDKLTYANEQYLFYRRLTETGRRTLVVNREFDMPSAGELEKIRRRGRYASAEEMAVDLAGSLPAGPSRELTRLEQRAYVTVIMDEAKQGTQLTALLQTAVILLCWIRRYTPVLFNGWRETDLPCLILMGHCRTEREALFLKWLSMMPSDILILAPNLSQVCVFSHPLLLEIEGEESLPETDFPTDAATMQMRTVASHAQEELNTLLYTDSGLFRDRQFVRADALVLGCTQDEVDLYWKQDNKYRPGFGTEGGVVRIPVIFAKESGVPDGDLDLYWHRIKKFSETEQTLLFRHMNICPPEEMRRHMGLSQRYLKDGRILTDALLSDRHYPYGALRREMQLHILLKAQEMLDQRLIRGTFENGTEYTVLSAALSLPREITRLIHAFDFTKSNPKAVCVHTEEKEGTLEDAILLTLLSMIGFDIVIFTPTGYQSIERHLAGRVPVEHQTGPYRFGVQMPDLTVLPPLKKGLQWMSNLLKRGI